MPKFTFGELITDKAEAFTAKLSPVGYTDSDVGFPVKFSTADTYTKCADNDEIEGFLFAVGPSPAIVDGVNIGSVWQPKFKEVVASGTIAIGDYVVAAAPISGTPRVKRTATAVTSLTHKWRVVSGAVGANAGNNAAIVIMRVA